MSPRARTPRSRAIKLKTQRTLVLVKPDGVQRHLVGDIIRRFEQAGLKIVGLKLVWATPHIIDRHYRHDADYLMSIGEKTIKGMEQLGLHVHGTPLEIGRRVRSYLSRHLSIGPVVAMVLQGTNAIRNVRQLVGSTDPLTADIGSIRGDLTIDTIQLADLEQRAVRNLVHASGDPEEAEREIPTWFSPGELHAYHTVMDIVLHDENWDRPSPGIRPTVRRRPAEAQPGAKSGRPAGKGKQR
ncbi:MAG: nucleoside-diphosphate kinase [Parcubacteria group bacterium Gr01-1014_38]|nr:MAG: nucleoside-diphosphate kinase [Parcubacteria group bacterium Gr01-1014_38]